MKQFNDSILCIRSHRINTLRNLTVIILPLFSIAVSWRRNLGGGYRANYKQAIAEHLRGGAKTKEMRLRQKR